MAIYALVILLSASVLALPISQAQPVSFVDSLFTAASALTITGLSTVDTATVWTPVGQSVILVLIQLGGIGIMSITTLSFLSAGRATLSMERLYFQELAGSAKVANALTLVKKIVLVTLLIEAIGVILMYFDLARHLAPTQAILSAVFHSISAFCNAGFALHSDSYMGYQADAYFLSVNSALILAGGLGFLVLVELWDSMRQRQPNRRYSLHLRLVMRMTVILVFGGAALLWVTEDFDFIQALFHSISSRSAGFNSLDLSTVTLPAISLIILLMYIGTAPGSTGGGIKTTSLATLVALGVQRFRGENNVTLLKRTIPTNLVIRAVAVALIGITAVALTTGLLVVFQTLDGPAPSNLLRDALFEATSAVCTVGLSIGLTSELTTASKITLIGAMIVGRLGLLTIAYGLAARPRLDRIKHAEGIPMIG
ncbi:MAG: TrkH family potassium uptake protein [Candidatus Zixiibacteriota bacterium]